MLSIKKIKHFVEKAIKRTEKHPKEWIPHLEDYPNLRGYFDKKWGKTPEEQIKNFINSYLEIDDILLLRDMIYKKPTQEYPDSYYVPIYSYSTKKDLYEEYLPIVEYLYGHTRDQLERDLDLTIKRIKNLYKELQNANYKEIYEFIKKKYEIRDINTAYKRDIEYINRDNIYKKYVYTKEFVEFYLKYVKTLSRQELFRGSQYIALKIVKAIHPEYFKKCLKQWGYIKDKINTAPFINLRKEVLGYRSFRKTNKTFYDFVMNRKTEDDSISYVITKYSKGEASFSESRDCVLDTLYSEKYDRAYFEERLTHKDYIKLLDIFITRRPSIDDFVFNNCVFWTIPRGGLEILGIFLYANNISKDQIPIISQYTTDERQIEFINHINKLQDKIQSIIRWENAVLDSLSMEKTNKEKLIEMLKDLLGDLVRIFLDLKEVKRKTSFRPIPYANMAFDGSIRLLENEKYFFLIDDYFNSGANMILLYNIIYHYLSSVLKERDESDPEKLTDRKIHLISISKRLNLGKYDPILAEYYYHETLERAVNESRHLLRVFNTYYHALGDSFNYISTQDVKTIFKLFPLIKKVLSGEIVDLIDTKIEFPYSPIRSIPKFLGFKLTEKQKKETKDEKNRIFNKKFREWIDNLIITVAYPHSIADGEAEYLLRELYGSRFKHSARKYIETLVAITQRVFSLK
ncbi:MAG: hypothetical protein GF317_23120 [Candidatus Lokiarchaeota archaeon]|nr:hypothetical protein [Candidatus Lokiarchaeota archaeon]